MISSNGEVNYWELTRSLRQKEVMEMECDLLVSNFKNPKTVALVKENIRKIPDGSLSHCAGPLNLVLRKAFELKKKERKPPSAMLRCTVSWCQQRHSPISYSSLGTPNRCPTCNYSYLECNGCGYRWTGGYLTCQSCGKAFV